MALEAGRLEPVPDSLAVEVFDTATHGFQRFRQPRRDTSIVKNGVS